MSKIEYKRTIGKYLHMKSESVDQRENEINEVQLKERERVLKSVIKKITAKIKSKPHWEFNETN